MLLNDPVSKYLPAFADTLVVENKLADAAAQDEAALDAREDALGAIAMERLRGRARRGDSASANLLDRENNPPCSPPGLFCDHDTSPDVADAINKKFEELRRATEALPGEARRKNATVLSPALSRSSLAVRMFALRLDRTQDTGSQLDASIDLFPARWDVRSHNLADLKL